MRPIALVQTGTYPAFCRIFCAVLRLTHPIAEQPDEAHPSDLRERGIWFSEGLLPGTHPAFRRNTCAVLQPAYPIAGPSDEARPSDLREREVRFSRGLFLGTHPAFRCRKCAVLQLTYSPCSAVNALDAFGRAFSVSREMLQKPTEALRRNAGTYPHRERNAHGGLSTRRA